MIPIPFPKNVKSLIPRDGLLLEWLLSGNANDTSGNARNGNVHNISYAIGRKGNVDECALFDAGYIDDSHTYIFNASNSLTISLWINWASITNDDAVFGFSYWNTYLSMLKAQNATNFILYTHNGLVVIPFMPNIGTWRHIVLVYGSDLSIRLYADRSIIYSSSYTVSVSAQPFLLGARSVYGGTIYPSFKGKMQQMRIYNRVLTTAEIEILYNE
jgi:hypothetical protein